MQTRWLVFVRFGVGFSGFLLPEGVCLVCASLFFTTRHATVGGVDSARGWGEIPGSQPWRKKEGACERTVSAGLLEAPSCLSHLSQRLLLAVATR